MSWVPNAFEHFEWEGDIEEARMLDFDKPSSFVGRVEYNTEEKRMVVSLSGTLYEFCKVPREIYNGFRDASSKGKYFNEAIKGLFDC